MTNLHQASVAALRHALDTKEISSVELTKHFLKRIEQFDPEFNSFISVGEDAALKQAQLADQRINSGDKSPLLGIPIAHKDIFCTTSLNTTCASKMLANFRSTFNATVVENLANAGAVTLGKTNMDEFAMGSSNETSASGACHNPWQPGRTPGGSSGGSAAAIAAGLTPLATGTDTGGSIRQPAAHCGLTGLKPTYGSISRWGMVAFASSLDQAGPMGRTAEDIAPMLSAMVSHDHRDSTSIKHPESNFENHLSKGVKGLKVGIPSQFFDSRLDSRIGDTVMAAARTLEENGAELIPVSLDYNHLSVASYYVIAPAEASANLSRFDGVRYGHRCKDPKDLGDLIKRSRSEGFGEEVKRRILIGTYALSAGYYDAYYKKAQQVRRLIKQDFVKAFESVDVILGPTAPNTAFKLGEKSADPTAMYLEDIFTLAVNLAGLPAMSLPCGFIDGLPVGMQLIGNSFSEGTLLASAHNYQQSSSWHKEFSPAAQREVTP